MHCLLFKSMKGDLSVPDGRTEKEVQMTWTVDSGQRTVDSGQWTVDSGQWTVDNGQWTVDSGQWTVDTSIGGHRILMAADARTAGRLRGHFYLLSQMTEKKVYIWNHLIFKL